MDDFILAASLSEIEGQRDFVLNELHKFGFKFNEKKSQVSPSVRKKFIGFVVEEVRSMLFLLQCQAVAKISLEIKILKESTMV